ncbi:MAG: lipopolysaccharide biosynthesis [Cyanothece sp. SIO2G6]|nr:lipopolysaccharide biosynthesis [Cyanothece sp. SIO2G6]
MAPPIVTRYLKAFQRHYLAGIIGFAGVTAISGFMAIQPPPPVIHQSRGILVYAPPPLTFSATAASIQQQAQAVTGRGLISDELLDAVAAAVSAQGETVTTKALRANVRAVVSSEGTFQVTVSYKDGDQDRAELINGLFLEALVEQSRIFNAIQITRVKENLNELLPQVEADVRRAEAELEAYVRTEAPLLASAQDGSLISSIAGSQTSQREIELALVSLNTQIESLQARLGLTPDQAYASSALSSDPIIANLRVQLYQNESQIAVLQQRLRPEHPQMVELLNQQQAYEVLLQQRVTEVIGGQNGTSILPSAEQIRQNSSLDPARQQLANQLVALHAEQERQQQLLISQQNLEQQLREEYSQLPNKQIKQAELAQNVAFKQSFFNEIQARLADVTLAEKEAVGSFVIAQPPTLDWVEEGTSSPIVVLLIGSVIGVVVGGALIFVLDSADPTFHMFSDLQSMLRDQEVPILGLLPYVPLDDAHPRWIPVITPVDSPYLEAFERFRSNLKRATGKTPPKVVVVSSTLAQEGKTFTAYNLAIASARAGKRTLLIEADLRSPSQAHVLDAEPDTDSDLDPIRYYDPVQNSIRLVPSVENLYILPHPGIQLQPAAVLESSEMRRTLEAAQGRFDLVVLDCPSLSRCNDALLMEPYTDGMLWVTRPGHTEEGLLMSAIEQFIESETTTVRVLGAVINEAELDITIPDDGDVDDPAAALLRLGEESNEELGKESDADVEVGPREDLDTEPEFAVEPEFPVEPELNGDSKLHGEAELNGEAGLNGKSGPDAEPELDGELDGETSDKVGAHGGAHGVSGKALNPK